MRLKKNVHLSQPDEVRQALGQVRDWSPRQWLVLEGLLMELRHAEEQRQHWHRLIAEEVLGDLELLALVRLCGVREITVFALGAFIGDIRRFTSPKKLVKFIGFNPAFDDSGAGEWSGGIGGHGHRLLRSLLVEGAQAILWCSASPLAQWGKKLLARKGVLNLIVCAMARKLTVAVWYLMMGRWTAVEEVDRLLRFKIDQIIKQVGTTGLEQMSKTRKALRQQIIASLKDDKQYVLEPSGKYKPRAATSLA